MSHVPLNILLRMLDSFFVKKISFDLIDCSGQQLASVIPQGVALPEPHLAGQRH